MAKRRFGFRKKARSYYRGFRRGARRVARAGGVGNLTAPVQVDAMLYGALREKVSSALDPLTSKIPFGTLADEIGMGALDWIVAKKANGMVRNVAIKGLIVENARVGEVIASQGLGILGGASAQSSDTFMYG